MKNYSGLTPEEVIQSRRKHGSNDLLPPPPVPWWKLLARTVSDRTIIVLSTAAVISIGISLYTGHPIYDGIGILAAIFIAVSVGFYSELKSHRAFHSLLTEARRYRVKVIRDGQVHTVPTEDVVKDDIVLLETGDRVPCDGVILEAVDLTLDTSTITGESIPQDGSAGDRVYRGYVVSSGSAVMQAQAVGAATEMGRIRDALSSEPEPTPLQDRLAELADRIGLVGTMAAFLIFLALAAHHISVHGMAISDPAWWSAILDAFIVAVTIVVVAVPEGLPLAVTLSLALNMRRMVRDKNLVRTLAATETLGSATVICSDKTGTLTLNRMKVTALWNPGDDPGTKCYLPPYDRLMHWLFAVNSTAHLEFEDGQMRYIGNSTEGALLAYLYEHDKDYTAIRASAEIIARRSFSSETKMMSTLVRWDDQHNMLLVKGAPEKIIERCAGWAMYPEDDPRPIDEIFNDFNKILHESTSAGQRILAFAYKPVPRDITEITDDGLIFWGLAIIKDPIRRQVHEALEGARSAGVDVKMVTGDNLGTARSIAEELGLLQKGDIVLTGDEFAAMSEEEAASALPKLRILARSRPHDKYRLVSLLKQAGEVVAVTGDGTNDAPALRKADVGIAMGKSGTEVAKEASDVVLLDDNFSTIMKGVVWGRSLRANIQKFLQFQLTVNLAALLTAFVGALLGGRSPLTAVQLLWVNLIMDTLAAIALGLEPPDPALLEEPPRGRTDPLITPYMITMIAGMGLYTFAALMFLLHRNFLGEGPVGSAEHLSVVFTTFVFIQIFNEINARSVRPSGGPLKNLHKSWGFLAIMLLIVVIQVLLTQFGGPLFQTHPLSASTWMKIILFSATALPVGYLLRIPASWAEKKFLTH